MCECEWECECCKHKVYILGFSLGVGVPDRRLDSDAALTWAQSDELTRCHNLAHGATASCISRPVLLCEMSTLFLVGFCGNCCCFPVMCLIIMKKFLVDSSKL